MKRILCVLVALAVGLCCCVPVAASPLSQALPTVSAQSAILVNAEDGTVYFSKNADAPLGMASTTKLMTALCAAEACEPEQLVTVSPQAVGVEGSSVYLVAGEQLTMRELLYALLLSSANDAAAAIAIEIDGSVERFAERMNRRAADMGLCSTHFTNPHGLYDENHYTTAAELAVLAAEVLRIPLLREIVGTYKTTISHDGKPDTRLLVNHNKLLRTYEGAIGMKTGFTKKTGRALVSAAERDGLTLIAVTLNAPDDWRDHTAMLDYGFASYEKVTLCAAGSFLFHLPVTGGEEEHVTLTNLTELTLTLPKEREEPRYTVTGTSRFWFAPVKEGDAFGTVTISCEGKSVSSPLIAAHAVSELSSPKKSAWERIRDFFTAE